MAISGIGLRLRTTVLLGLAALLAGCQTQACTAVGCVSAVTVNLSAGAAGYGTGPVTARLCVADTCTTKDVRLDSADVPVVEGRLPTSVADGSNPAALVTLRLTRGSTVLTDTTLDVDFTPTAPNGGSCGPVCYFAALFLQDGALHRFP